MKILKIVGFIILLISLVGFIIYGLNQEVTIKRLEDKIELQQITIDSLNKVIDSTEVKNIIDAL